MRRRYVMESIAELWLLVKYLILGLVQGITEPIPISSSGHLIIVRKLFGIEAEGLSFEIFVNFASLLAVLIIYRNDIIRIMINGFNYITKKEETARSEEHTSELQSRGHLVCRLLL